MDDNAHTIAKHFIDNLSPGITREAQELARAYLTLEAILPAWRDIADAPKDGSLFPAMEDGKVIVVCWGEMGGMVLNMQGEPDDAPMCWLDVNKGEEAYPELWLPAAPQGEQPKKEI